MSPEHGGVASHRLSEAAAHLDNGRAYRLFTAVPRLPPPPGGFPTLYLLDGNAAFAELSPALLAAAPGLLLIGVGYPTAERFAIAERWLDYTPPLAATPVPDPRRPDRLAGGGRVFLDALTGPLRGLAEAGLPVDPARRSLWGHSFGGLFALYTLLTRPASFAGYVPVSPSLWWEAAAVDRLERGAPPCASGASVLVMLGDREVRSDQPPPPRPGPAPATLQLIDRLARRPDLAVSARVLTGMGHGQAFAASLPLALAAAAAVPPARPGAAG